MDKTMRLEKYTENDKQLYTQLVFNEALMQMNYGRVFTEEEAQMIFQWIVKQNSGDSQFGDYKVFVGEEETEVADSPDASEEDRRHADELRILYRQY